MTVNDEKIAENIESAREIWLTEYPNLRDIEEHAYSDDFIRKIKRMDKSLRRGTSKKKQEFGKVAILFATVIIVVFSATMSVKASREFFFNLFKDKHRNYIEFTYESKYDESEGEYEPRFELGYIPMGYLIVNETETEQSQYKEFCNAEGDWFSIKVYPIGDVGTIRISLDDYSYKEIEKNNVHYYVMWNDDTFIIKWFIKQLSCSYYGTLSEEESWQVLNQIKYSEKK